jgi:uncharacterized membrane-anchored protein YjiN (DUF445 family)
MKRRASALLLVAAAVFVVARLYEPRVPGLGYLRAFAEAAMVGGLADWFAVTALFRHPLGIPIPHTAIVPSRKDRIGRSLGRFVQQNFLSREVVGAKLDGARLGARLGGFLADPAKSRLVARQVAAGLHGAAEVLRDEDVHGFVERGLVARARRVQVAPLVGAGARAAHRGGRHQELLDAALRLAARAVADHEMFIRERIAAEAPWWVPGAVEDKIHEKVVGAVEQTLADVSADPAHPLRARFDHAVQEFAERLRTSPETIARAEGIKEELLAHPAVREYAGSVWTDVKAALARHAGRALPPAGATGEHAVIRAAAPGAVGPEAVAAAGRRPRRHARRGRRAGRGRARSGRLRRDRRRRGGRRRDRSRRDRRGCGRPGCGRLGGRRPAADRPDVDPAVALGAGGSGAAAAMRRRGPAAPRTRVRAAAARRRPTRRRRRARRRAHRRRARASSPSATRCSPTRPSPPRSTGGSATRCCSPSTSTVRGGAVHRDHRRRLGSRPSRRAASRCRSGATCSSSASTERSSAGSWGCCSTPSGQLVDAAR